MIMETGYGRFTAKYVSRNSKIFRMKTINQYQHCHGPTKECFGAFPDFRFFLMENFSFADNTINLNVRSH